MTDRADEVTLEIERKLCSFCCEEPCHDCYNPCMFEPAERAAVAEIIRCALEHKP
jgi:hypothetical protein